MSDFLGADEGMSKATSYLNPTYSLLSHLRIWWLSRTIRELREECCDDLVRVGKKELAGLRTLGMSI